MTINCKGQLLDLEKPKVMAILNLTPDSFFDGGRNNNISKALKKTEEYLNEGANIIDIGAQSSRPGADFLEEEEELQRMMPTLEAILQEFPQIIISVDTFWSKVARESIAAGAAIINDISAGSIDEKMLETVGELKVPYILMHMQGTPTDMQKNPQYENITIEINQFFAQKIQALKKLGVNDIILDPGYGFGKNLNHNYELLQNQKFLGFEKFPILVGISRKSMLCRLLKVNPENALNGTTALHMLTLLGGAHILRVHDVREAVESIQIFEAFKNPKKINLNDERK